MESVINEDMNTPVEIPFQDEAGFRNAVDIAIAAATKEIRIFDDKLERIRLDDKERHELLWQFLAASPLRRLYIVVHDTSHAETRSPRLLVLIRHFPNAVEIRESSAEYKHVTDCCLLVDSQHGVRRFHRDHARGKLILNSPDEIRPWWQRFDELWRSGTPCLAPTMLGL
jgi:hypothetical protein